MVYMVIDTEFENSPRKLISIAYLIINEEGDILHSVNKLVKHNINLFQIDENGHSFKIHGITNEKCQLEGENINNILLTFTEDLDKVDSIIGHNLIGADIVTIRKESILMNDFWKKCLRDKIKNKKIYDTYNLSKKNLIDYENHKLNTVYENLFNKKIDNHHDALSDCHSTYQIYEYLKKNYNLEEETLNFNEDKIGKYRCNNCNQSTKNYYIYKKEKYVGKPEKYTFKPYLFNGLYLEDKICFECYKSIEIIKYNNNEAVEIITSSTKKNKNNINYIDYENTQKFCFECL